MNRLKILLLIVLKDLWLVSMFFTVAAFLLAFAFFLIYIIGLGFSYIPGITETFPNINNTTGLPVSFYMYTSSLGMICLYLLFVASMPFITGIGLYNYISNKWKETKVYER